MPNPPFLTQLQLAKAQAEVEGFANGPNPALNLPNINTQDSIGNPQTPTSSPVPYYPSAETPNLQLSTEDMSSQLANNFVTLDLAVSSGTSTTPAPTFVSGASYTALSTDTMLLVSTTPSTVHLNSALPIGTTLIIKNISPSGVVTVTPTSGTIDGQPSFTITSGFGTFPSINVRYAGSGLWFVY